MTVALLAQGLRSHEAGDLPAAEKAYLQVLQTVPNHPDALHLLGMLTLQRGNASRAIELICRAIGGEPLRAEFHCNLATAYETAGQLDVGQESLRRAIQLNPSYFEAFNNLGGMLGRAGDFVGAADCFRKALGLQPDSVTIQINLAHAVCKQGKHAEAEELYRQVLRERPESAEVHHGLAVAFDGRQAPLGDVEAELREALRWQPGNAETHSLLGNVLNRQGREDEALAAHETALRLRPDFGLAHFCRALIWLRRGDFARGWLEYEWRWKREGMPPLRVLPQPLWDGSPLEGKTILLYSEQGLGDTLQFIRYAALVKEKGGTVVVECQPPVARLLTRCAGVDRVVRAGEPLPAFDFRAPLMSLPGLLGTHTMESIPNQVPYLFVDELLLRSWRRRLGQRTGFRVGVCWQGNIQFSGDRDRSVPLRLFEAFTEVPGVQLYCLQRDEGRSQLFERTSDWPIVDLGERFTDMAETAAAVKQLDLVVTIDSALAHLAGGLGIPVWVALPFLADWRWFLNRGDSPWYPTARLYRQRQPRDWASVFGPMAAELQRLLQERRSNENVALPGENFRRKALSWDMLLSWRAGARQQGQTVVWTNGCFDLLHVGHLRSLEAARAMGDFLVVGINSDASARRLKGASRPFVPAEQRLELLTGLACVDYVVVFDEDTPESALTRLQPDVHVKGADYAPPHGKVVPEGGVIASYGGRVAFLPLVPELSTSAICSRFPDLPPGAEN